MRKERESFLAWYFALWERYYWIFQEAFLFINGILVIHTVTLLYTIFVFYRFYKLRNASPQFFILKLKPQSLRMWPYLGSKDSQKITRCYRRYMEQILPLSPQRVPHWLKPWSWISSLQKIESIIFCCSKPPSLWSFVWQPQETDPLPFVTSSGTFKKNFIYLGCTGS